MTGDETPAIDPLETSFHDLSLQENGRAESVTETRKA
jgi:hypothetical protein